MKKFLKQSQELKLKQPPIAIFVLCNTIPMAKMVGTISKAWNALHQRTTSNPK
jgi:hypothetical protein